MILLNDLTTNVLAVLILGVFGAILSMLIDLGKRLLGKNNDDKLEEKENKEN